MITSCRWSMLIWSQDVTCQTQQLFKGICHTPQALQSFLVFSYCLRIQYCTLGDCSFESVQLSSGGSDHTINAETSPTLLYWKRLKTNIKEKSELKYLQLSFLLQSVHSASISAYQTSTDMWTVLWMESWDNRLFITCNHLYLYLYIIKGMQTFWHKSTPETCQSVPKLLLIHSLLLCR